LCDFINSPWSWLNLVTTSVENRIWKTKIQQFGNPKTTTSDCGVVEFGVACGFWWQGREEGPEIDLEGAIGCGTIGGTIGI